MSPLSGLLSGLGAGRGVRGSEERRTEPTRSSLQGRCAIPRCLAWLAAERGPKSPPIRFSGGDSVLDSALDLRDSFWICVFVGVIPVLLIGFCVDWFCFSVVLIVYVFDFV